MVKSAARQSCVDVVVCRTFDDFVRVPQRVFLTLGYDFVAAPKPRWLHWLLRALFYTCLGGHLYNDYYMMKRVLEWQTLAGNMEVLTRYGTELTFVYNCNVKFVTFLRQRQRIREVYERLRQLYPEAAECAAYGVDTYYWPPAVRCLVKVYFSSCVGAIVVPFAQSWYIYAWDVMHLGSANATFPYIRAYPMAYGFHAHGPWRYLLTCLLEVAHTHFLIVGNLGTDLWLICFIAQLCMHYAHIARTLRQHEPRVQQQAADCQLLEQLIVKHQHLLELNQELNNIFGNLLGYNLLSTAGVLCTVAIYTLADGFNVVSISFLVFLIPTTAQFYLICHYGQLLINLSESIATAAYQQNWHNACEQYKKQILLIIMRAQKPAALHAMGLLSLSLDTFRLLMNMTYRIFALLKTLIQ